MEAGAMGSIMTIVAVRQTAPMQYVVTVVKIIPYALHVVTTVVRWHPVEILRPVSIVHPDVL